jgi:hypothetical protein
MNNDRDSRDDRVTHPGSAEPAVGAWAPLPEPPPVRADRPDGSDGSDGERYRRARRRSRMTGAALAVGSGAAAVTLAYHLLPAGPPAAGSLSSTGGPGTTGVGTTKVTQTGHGPVVTRTIATTSASGVTTYKTVQVVNGKTVVTHVHKATPASFHDD